MKVQLIRDGDAKEYAVIFAKGDEAFSGSMEFVREVPHCQWSLHRYWSAKSSDSGLV
jgi:hypothetical protein